MSDVTRFGVEYLETLAESTNPQLVAIKSKAVDITGLNTVHGFESIRRRIEMAKTRIFAANIKTTVGHGT